ncbi:ABC transporter substrate-binding protein [Kitasatospora purpeofusca]|uniref:ABC transporter substrate-binding protein n=1 Tax=Kitasatospora purpeofusca TaxID=67352 RepID=UPI002251369A|nr:ABC transporter substrate-binding protein [Kitasatospora purpeofusca]MCX4756740.1 ABC transporter substrate-binding protein [Kitasatospora purpeofusca]WSR35470.1 ABC transporter substrate-binding protein [Kitasatospora purpeofusca]
MAITLGVHASNPSLYYLSRLDYLDEELAPLGETGAFHHYTDGTRTGELLAEGVIDFGGTGSTPPVTAQAAGHDLVYAAVSAPRPDHGALLVSADGPVHSVADLKGGTVVLGIGSWQTHLLAKALHAEGLSYATDVTAVRPAAGQDQARRLREGEIIGWIAQGAELAAARRDGGFRELVRTGDVITDRSVFFTRRGFAVDRPEVVAAIVTALGRADAWVAANLSEAAAIAAADLGGSAQDWRTALAGLPWRLEPATAGFVAEQQEAADIFHRVGFVDRPVVVADAHLPALEAPVAAAATAATTATITAATADAGTGAV